MPSKAYKSKSTAKRQPAAEPTPKPNWPPLQPLASTSDLSLNTLLPGQIVTIQNLWTSALCRNYVSFLSSLPLATTPNQPKKGDALRVNDRFVIEDSDFAEKLWSSTGLKELVTGTRSQEEDGEEQMSQEERKALWGGEVCGLNPRIRVYRYKKGQFFDQHYDESNTMILPTSPPTPARTTWTLLLYLTGPATGCVGGETVFYPELGQAKSFFGISGVQRTDPVVVGLKVGMALLHKHGQDCLLHEGREVTAGEKWIIRSDLCVRR